MECEEKLKTSQKILHDIVASKYTDEQLFQAFQLLEKILNNIVHNPNEEKYKSIKRTNATLQKILFSIKEIEGLLEILGFVNYDERMTFEGGHVEDLRKFTMTLHTYLERIQSRHLTAAEIEDLEKRKLLEERRKQLEEENRHKEEKEKKLRELMELDRKEQSKREKARDSHAEQRDFGAHTKTWQDIGVNLNAQPKR